MTTVLGTLAVLSVLLCGCCQAQDLPGKWSGRVKLEVAGEAPLTDTVVSYISRELRALGDIELVQVNPDFAVSVVALENTVEEGRRVTGYTLAVVITKPVQLNLIDALLGDTVPETGRDSLKKTFKDAVEIKDQSCKITPVEHLQKTCREIVIDLDTRCLQPARMYWQKGIDYMKEIREKKKAQQ